MPNKTQAEVDALFKNIGGALSGFKLYRAAANLIGSSSYFLLKQRDEFSFFTDLSDQFKKVKNLRRFISYSGSDDILRLEITQITPGISFTLKFVLAYGGTPVSTASGQYGTDATIIPGAGQDFAPVGKIKLTAPTGGTPGSPQRVEIRVIPSAARLLLDMTGETEEEQLVKATAVESHRATAQNFRGVLLTSAIDRVFTNRIMQGLVGKFLGVSTKDLFKENQKEQPDGSVTAAPTGLFVELNSFMDFNTPEQFVKKSSTSTTTFSALATGGQLGTFTVNTFDPAAGRLRLACTRGFFDEIPDPEQFSVEYISEFLERTVTSDIRLRVNKQYQWPRGGLTIRLDRKTTSADPFGRMTSPLLTLATPNRIPLQKLRIETLHESGAQSGFFRVREPKSNTIISFVSPVGNPPLNNGVQTIPLTNGMELTFNWTNNPSAQGMLEINFDLTIFPYTPGDIVESEVTLTTTGRLQLEMRRNFDFAFGQSSASPTITDDVVAPDIPFIVPLLGS